MARPGTAYEPRSPGHGALYQIVRDHFETFRAQAAAMRDGEGLPRFGEPRRSLGGGGPSAPPICSTTCSPTCPCGSGS